MPNPQQTANMIRSFCFALTVVATASCIEPASEQPKADMGAEDMQQVPDQGADSGADLGGDAAPDAPDEPCGGACAGATPICNPANDMCVACLASTDCAGSAKVCDTSNNSCVACLSDSDCTGGDPACDTITKTCVACVNNSTCNDASASKCSGNICGACQVKDDCSHITGKTACDAGVCKQCSKDDDSACGANSCDLATNTCTNTPKGSVGECGACVADSECDATTGYRCINLSFGGAPRGGFCLQQADEVGGGVCPLPYQVIVSSTSVGGAVSEPYCGINQTLVTCDAVLDMLSNKNCNNDDVCGVMSVNDGKCLTFPGLGEKCTVECSDNTQCASPRVCRTVSGQPNNKKYCAPML